MWRYLAIYFASAPPCLRCCCRYCPLVLSQRVGREVGVSRYPQRTCPDQRIPVFLADSGVALASSPQQQCVRLLERYSRRGCVEFGPLQTSGRQPSGLDCKPRNFTAGWPGENRCTSSQAQATMTGGSILPGNPGEAGRHVPDLVGSMRVLPPPCQARLPPASSSLLHRSYGSTADVTEYHLWLSRQKLLVTGGSAGLFSFSADTSP